MKACCNYKPTDRPSFTVIAEHLEAILADFTTIVTGCLGVLACRSALMKACCSYKPKDRPSFTVIAEHLEAILADFTAAEADSQRVTV